MASNSVTTEGPPRAPSPTLRPARGTARRLLASSVVSAATLIPLLYAAHLGRGDDVRRADVAAAAENHAATALFRWSNDGRLSILRPAAARPSLELRVPASEWAALSPAEHRALQRNLSFAAVRGVAIDRYDIRDDAGDVLATGAGQAAGE